MIIPLYDSVFLASLLRTAASNAVLVLEMSDLSVLAAVEMFSHRDHVHQGAKCTWLLLREIWQCSED